MFSACYSRWRRACPPDQQLPLSTLVRLSLPEYFAGRGLPSTQADAGGPVAPLLFTVDQFEELLTLDPADIAAKRAFCQQLGVLLDNRQLWALFVLARITSPASTPTAC